MKSFLVMTFMPNKINSKLSQIQKDQEVVLSYGSRTLTKPERNYCVTRRELLAIIFGLRKFRHYLLGRHVLIQTDHVALKWVMAFKEPEGQVARWAAGPGDVRL